MEKKEEVLRNSGNKVGRLLFPNPTKVKLGAGEVYLHLFRTLRMLSPLWAQFEFIGLHRTRYQRHKGQRCLVIVIV